MPPMYVVREPICVNHDHWGGGQNGETQMHIVCTARKDNRYFSMFRIAVNSFKKQKMNGKCDLFVRER